MSITDNKMAIGQEVYLKTDTDQLKRMVIGILIRGNGIEYQLACGASNSWHYEIELSEAKDLAYSTSN